MGTESQFIRQAREEDLKRIDQAALRVLKETGVRISDAGYLDKLKAAGVRIDADEQKAFFDPDWIRERLSSAPAQFTLCSRSGEHDLSLGAGTVHFANGGRVFRIIDLGTKGHRRTMLRDVRNTATLVDKLDQIDFYIIACQAHDVDAEHYHLNDFFQAFNHTGKHVMGGCDTLEGVRQVYELATLIAGGEDNLRERPFFSVITNPISPLTIESVTLGILEFCSVRGIPVTCGPAPIAGATAPATLAGALAQMHAEALAGAALTQVFQPGAKALYGAVPTTMDLRTMEFTMGSVEMAIMTAWAPHLARLYHLPIYASGGVTESKGPDIQAGVEKTFSLLMAASAGGDCIHLAAGMLDSGNSISYEQYVIDNEIIGMVRRLLQGITVNEETLAVDVIDKVGPGGAYIAEDHTIEHMMDEFFYPSLAVRCNFDIWEERDRPSMLSRAIEKVDEILGDGEEGLLDADLTTRLKEAFPMLRSGA